SGKVQLGLLELQVFQLNACRAVIGTHHGPDVFALQHETLGSALQRQRGNRAGDFRLQHIQTTRRDPSGEIHRRFSKTQIVVLNRARTEEVWPQLSDVDVGDTVRRVRIQGDVQREAVP